MLENNFQVLYALFIGHALADYPLQNDFLAKAKNHKASIPYIDWRIALINHSLIHSGFVWIITGRWELSMLELFLHSIIDWLKCDSRTSFRVDQALHVLCKIVYVLIISYTVG